MRRIHRAVVSILAGALVLSLADVGAQEWNAGVEALRSAIASAGGAAAHPGADGVVVFDRREVEVEPSGLSRTVQHTLKQALTACRQPRPRGRAALRTTPSRPTSRCCAAGCFGADGSLREVDPKTVLDAPDPQNLIYWNSRHKTVPMGRLEPGDAVELVTRRVGFTYALLLDGDQDPTNRASSRR